jgi:hypothetical protein
MSRSLCQPRAARHPSLSLTLSSHRTLANLFNFHSPIHFYFGSYFYRHLPRLSTNVKSMCKVSNSSSITLQIRFFVHFGSIVNSLSACRIKDCRCSRTSDAERITNHNWDDDEMSNDSCINPGHGHSDSCRIVFNLKAVLAHHPLARYRLWCLVDAVVCNSDIYGLYQRVLFLFMASLLRPVKRALA